MIAGVESRAMRKGLAAGLLLPLLCAGCARPLQPAGRLPFLGLNRQGAAEYWRARDGAVMVLVPGGPYARRPYEPSATTAAPEAVDVPGFLMDTCEVTNRRFAAFLNAMGTETGKLAKETPLGLRRTRKGWEPQPGLAEHPAVGVTGFGAEAYARWAGARLPTPDEWMKAAGGPEGLEYPWGAWEVGRCCWQGVRTVPVQSMEGGASPYGCLHMAGNAYERVMHRGRPVMLKGGSWMTAHPLNLRVLDLCMQPMEAAEQSVGFRCAIGAPGVVPPAAPGTDGLRLARSMAAALAEAGERNCPVLLSLHYDTCGQCDRVREGLFRDPEFVRFANAHCVVAVGQAPGDARGRPHPPLPDGRCPLWHGLTCAEHEAIFAEGLRCVRSFRVSPGCFVLAPDGTVLVGEEDLPKSGDGAEVWIDRVREACVITAVQACLKSHP